MPVIDWDPRPSIDNLARMAAAGLAPDSMEFTRNGDVLVVAYRNAGSKEITLIECRVVREGPTLSE